MKYRNVQEVVSAYDAGDMGLAEMPGYLMDFIDEQNVGEVIAALPDEYRDFFLEWASNNYLSDGTVNIGGEYAAPIAERAISAIRGWFRRHRPGAGEP